ncbi:MAG: hypothetical protein V1817_01850, partial [Candidatus Micrarchaeota archaeon]
LDEIASLYEAAGEAAAQRYEIFRNLDFEEQKAKMVWLEHHAYSRLFAALGMDWKPSNEILERVKGKPLANSEKVYAELDHSNKERAREWWVRFLHPDSGFFPNECKTKNVA